MRFHPEGRIKSTTFRAIKLSENEFGGALDAVAAETTSSQKPIPTLPKPSFLPWQPGRASCFPHVLSPVQGNLIRALMRGRAGWRRHSANRWRFQLSACNGKFGTTQRNKKVAHKAPALCATIKQGNV